MDPRSWNVYFFFGGGEGLLCGILLSDIHVLRTVFSLCERPHMSVFTHHLLLGIIHIRLQFSLYFLIPHPFSMWVS